MRSSSRNRLTWCSAGEETEVGRRSETMALAEVDDRNGMGRGDESGDRVNGAQGFQRQDAHCSCWSNVVSGRHLAGVADVDPFNGAQEPI